MLIKTPLTTKSIRRVQRAYETNPSPRKLEILFRSQQQLAAQHEIDKHVQKGLFKTIKEEKQRRRRGKRLNLVGEEAGSAELWDIAKILHTQELAKQKTDKAIQDKDNKAAEKVAKAKDKLEKAIKAHEEKVYKVRQVREQYVRTEAKKEIKQRAKQAPKGSKIVILPLPKLSKPFHQVVSLNLDSEVVVEEEGVISRSTRTRKVKLLARYKK